MAKALRKCEEWNWQLLEYEAAYLFVRFHTVYLRFTKISTENWSLINTPNIALCCKNWLLLAHKGVLHRFTLILTFVKNLEANKKLLKLIEVSKHFGRFDVIVNSFHKQLYSCVVTNVHCAKVSMKWKFALSILNVCCGSYCEWFILCISFIYKHICFSS